ncbi:RagB/SusD family nutrient uptake outer membrane protein [Pedobacter ureilyticus]|uniref:RagB/SusD family nutrient uptake outer membrane protein n=1 Tax=Pedobacter ureilyticus TaxID=1393051 RepID=A0ABW9J9S0_9SPHI|nr:RagB/SusD family nutrient uptake outer membrane protein [Pedobacter helvus]
MLKYIYSTLIGVILLSATGCRKYVEVAPVNIKILKNTSDFQALLYNANLLEVSYSNPLYAADDLESDDIRWQTALSTVNANIYTWGEKIYSNTEEDTDWQKLYEQLYTCNTVINGVLESEGGTDDQKKTIRASALLHRAFIFHTLVNLYAKQYDASTADTDPGIPLVMGTTFFINLSRSSVAKVYEQIESDLNTAIPALNNLPDFPTNASKAGAYGMLARVHLHKRNFSAAKRNAELALALKGTLLNLATVTTYPNRNLHPENVFFKRVSSYPVALPLSASLLNLFDTNDIRYTTYTAPASIFWQPTFTNRSYAKQRVIYDGINTGPSVPEMILIKAECEARADNAGAAMATLNNLRQNRFKPEHYVAFAASNGEQALRLVLDERRRELMGTGLRWFDQRRLSKDNGLMPTINRAFKGTTLTLAPNSNRYTFPIGDKYIQFNPEITQNPR